MRQKWFSIAATVLIIAFAVSFLVKTRGMSLEQLLNLIPANAFLAVLWLLLFYLLKTLSVLFPSAILQVAAGMIFPLPIALAVTVAGMWLSVSFGYCIGRFAGRDNMNWILQKYPKAQKHLAVHLNHPIFLCYFLRVVGCLPMDLVSMLLGSLRIPYGRYLSGTFCGVLPMAMAITALGTVITEPGSPLFWCAALGTIVISVVSWLFYRSRTLGNKADKP